MNQLIILPGVFSGSLWKIVSSTSLFGVFILFILLIMSIVSWVIIFHKWRQFKNVDNDNYRFQQHFHRSPKLKDALGQAKSNSSSPLSQIYLSGFNEIIQLKKQKNQGGALQEKINPLNNDDYEIVEMAMDRTLTEGITFLEKNVIFLATTANAAPFLGLLGTVVGIMNAFWSIGERGSASLAIVAPGIAEALLATIVGLGAAIPAVVAFNWANNKLKHFNDLSNNFILEFMSLIKKESR